MPRCPAAPCGGKERPRLSSPSSSCFDSTALDSSIIGLYCPVKSHRNLENLFGKPFLKMLPFLRCFFGPYLTVSFCAPALNCILQLLSNSGPIISSHLNSKLQVLFLVLKLNYLDVNTPLMFLFQLPLSVILFRLPHFAASFDACRCSEPCHLPVCVCVPISDECNASFKQDRESDPS